MAKTDREATDAKRKQGAAETEHVHGSMDITAHEKTFSGFITACIWVAGFSIAVLIFLALVNL